MFGNRTKFGFKLEVTTAMHIGTGDWANLTSGDGSNTEVAFATVVRDHAGNPYLPSTTIKGALRQIAALYFPDDAATDYLFGSIKDKHTQGSMGQLQVGAGHSTKEFPGTEAAPFNSSCGVGAFVAARTAIDAARGVAEDHKLFHQEMIAPENTFDVELVLLEFGKHTPACLALLKKVLGVVARDGLTLGKSKADGQGHLIVVGANVLVTELKLNGDGILKPDKVYKIAASSANEDTVKTCIDSLEANLTCEFPFAVKDSSVTGSGKEIAKKEGSVAVSAQRYSDTQPLLMGSSISGALRARATWLMKLHKMRGEKKLQSADETTINLLFGAKPNTGSRPQKALVEIRKLEIGKAVSEEITSLKVDRFSGAPVYGALFTTAAFTGTSMKFQLALTERGSVAPDEAALKVFDLLKDDIMANGLQLGHGTNKGFGWFKPVGDN